MNEGVEKKPTGEWRAGLLRVTAFLSPENPVVERDFWKELGLDEADSYEKKKGQTTVQGALLDNWLMVISTASRIDWLFLPNPQDQKDTPEEKFGIRNTGPFPEMIDSFVGFLRNWFSTKCPALYRLALGATINLPVNDRLHGYQQLSPYLKFPLDGENSSDFLFQINRWRKSRVIADLRINRLTKWSVALLAGLEGEIKIGLESAPSVFRRVRSQSVCQATLDINSDAEFAGQINPDQASNLLDEFVVLAKEIAAQGDIP